MSNEIKNEDLEKVSGGKGINIKICSKCGEKFPIINTKSKDLYYDHIRNCGK